MSMFKTFPFLMHATAIIDYTQCFYCDISTVDQLHTPLNMSQTCSE